MKLVTGNQKYDIMIIEVRRGYCEKRQKGNGIFVANCLSKSGKDGGGGRADSIKFYPPSSFTIFDVEGVYKS